MAMISHFFILYFFVSTIKGQSGNCLNDDLRIITLQGDRCLCPEGFIPSSNFLSCLGCGNPANVPGFNLRIYSNRTQFGYAIGSIAAYYPPNGNRVVLESLNKGIMCRYDNGALGWSQFIPYSYEEILCDPPFVGHPTITTITGNWKPGTVATFSCPVGYTLVGSTTSTCNNEGTFEPGSPFCQPIQCDPSVLTPLAVTMNVLGDQPYVVENFFSVSCIQSTQNVRKVVNGENFYRCGDQGTFYPPINAVCIDFDGTCVEGSTCLNGGRCIDEAHRSVQLTAAEAAIDPDNICSCPLGFHGWNCGQRNYCPRITGIQNGVVTQPAISYSGDIYTVVCGAGFRLSGSASVSCRPDGSWSEATPLCQPIGGCSRPPEITNGYVYFFSTFAASTALYACDFVCFLVGSPVVTCNNGAWSAIPTCNCASCNFPPSTSTLTVSLTTTAAQYTCPAERLLQNSEVLQCVNGQVVGTTPTCSASMSCGMPQPISNGQINTVTSTLQGGVATFFCNPGFRLDGINKICTAGVWVGNIACVLDNCGRPESDFFTISPVLDVYVTGSNVTITPNPNIEWGNYPTTSPVVLFCVDGFWNPPVPTRRPVFNCMIPVVVAPLRLEVNNRNNYIEFSCDPGFEIQGSRISLCVNGALDTPVPTCRAIPSVVLTCPIGQTLICPVITDQFNTGCSCFPIMCDPPVYPKWGGYTASGFNFGDTVTYSCYGNRRLVGSSTRTCTGTGDWSTTDPTCDDTSPCPNTGLNINFGTYTFTTYGAETFAIYTCNPGYKLLTVTYRYCQTFDSTWSTPIPSCEQISAIKTGIPSKVGAIGILGHRGPGGSDGDKGEIGVKGYKGLDGYKGLSGDIGVQGSLGGIGTKGLKGDKGIPGRKGIIGIKGIIGDVGNKGTDGATGSLGFLGSKGMKGSKGRKGISAILPPPQPQSQCVTSTCPAESICLRQRNVVTGQFFERCVCLPGVNAATCIDEMPIKPLSSTVHPVCLVKSVSFVTVECVPGFSDLNFRVNFTYSWELTFQNGTVYPNITTSPKYIISTDGKSLNILDPQDYEDKATLTCVLTTPPSNTFAITTVHTLNMTKIETTECNQTCGLGNKFLATVHQDGSYCSVDYSNPIPCGNKDSCNRCASCYNGNCNIKTIDNCVSSNQQCIKFEMNNNLLNTGCDFANLCPSSPNTNIINVNNQPLKVTCCRGQMCNDF